MVLDNIHLPLKKTLEKYGLTLDEWQSILRRQGNVCAICKIFPSTGRFYIDHEHVKGYKKMGMDEKRLYVRGLLCYMCNRFYVGRSITIEKSKNVTLYLEAYEHRKSKSVLSR